MLCDVCSAIDFNELFTPAEVNGPPRLRRAKHHGDSAAIALAAALGCELCRIVLEVRTDTCGSFLDIPGPFEFSILHGTLLHRDHASLRCSCRHLVHQSLSRRSATSHLDVLLVSGDTPHIMCRLPNDEKAFDRWRAWSDECASLHTS